jgi:hypothetical protein
MKPSRISYRSCKTKKLNRRLVTMKKAKPKKSGKIKLRHIGFILGVVAYYLWRRDSSSPDEAPEWELGFDGFDDNY